MQDVGACDEEMSLAPGGRMNQEIYDDPNEFSDWDLRHQSRCFVHLCNSQVWRQITSQNPPTVPPTSKEYNDAGLPWFAYYDEGSTARGGAAALAGLKSVSQLGAENGDVPLPENGSVVPQKVVPLRKGLARDQVREGSF